MLTTFLVPLTFVSLLATTPAAPRSAPVAPAPPVPALPAAATFKAVVDNPYFPLRPGTTWIFESRSGRHVETDTMTVTRGTRRIAGVAATVVHDRTWRDGALVEATADWYAQDGAGNVWYLGEDTREYRGGKVVSTAGSWEAGKDGARPGILVPAASIIGAAYRQEYKAKEAEDMGRVLSRDARATTPAGAYTGCLETEDWSPLEPGVLEHKYYARGVGLVLQETVKGGRERMALVKVVTP